MRTILFILLLSALPVSAANRVHNSSFECGSSGWTVWGSFSGDTFGNEAAVSSHVIATNASHGGKSLWWRTRAFSRPFYLTNGSYHVSFWAYSSTGFSITNQVTPIWAVGREVAELSYPASSMVAVPTNAWKRFTNSFTVPTNWLYSVKFFCVNPETITWIDEIQVAEGAAVTAYAPAAIIEVGMDTADSGNSLFLSDAKTLRFNLWNAGPQTNVTVPYDIYDLWNSNLASGAIATNALAANTNTTVNLSLPAVWGWQRPVCYVTNLNGTMAETTVSLLPYAEQTGYDTNGILGIHTHYSTYHLNHARRLGFTHNRLLSPVTEPRWSLVFPTLWNPSTYLGRWLLDYAVEYHTGVTNALVPFIPLTAADTEWHPETNASLAVMIGDYTNYVGRLVHRYKGSDYGVKWWEIWNEPQQEGRDTVALDDATIYANLFTNAAHLIKAIDPTAKIIAFGGYSSASQGWDAWTNFGGFTSYVDAVSFHAYPQAPLNFEDPNDPEDDAGRFVNISEITSYFLTNAPIWNTETATYSASGMKGLNVAFRYPYFFTVPEKLPDWDNEPHRNEFNVRQLPNTDDITQNALRCWGWGWKHYNIQSGRMTDDITLIADQGNPTIYELNGSIKPEAVALVIARNFVRVSGLGKITNAAEYNIEAYWFTNDLGTVVPIWNIDRASRTLTLSSASVALYDLMGNLLQTNSAIIPTTRSVRYLVSDALTPIQLRNAVSNASVSAITADTRPPQVSIDITPVGQTTVWNNVTNIFKWTAMDETSLPWRGTASKTNVLYRWSFDGVTWTAWNNTNHILTTFASQGKYALRVQCKDKANNISPILQGPSFGDLETPDPAPPTSLRVSGTARIGTVTVP